MKLTVHQIARTLGATYCGRDYLLTGFSWDSREMQNGMLFTAIVGERNNGHHYIRQLDEAYGEIAFLTTEPLDFKPRNPVFQVEDVRVALAMLAHAHLEGINARIVGVTGSVGKTTTKNFILSALAPGMKASGTKGNQNNELGIPATALNVEENDRVGVVEMGMRGLGQIADAARYVQPDLAVITNIGVAHLELLGSRENIAKAKLEMVDALKKDGVALLNGDEPLLYGARPEKTCFYFGLSAHNSFRAEEIQDHSFTLCYPGGKLPITLQVEGEHQIMNALAAFGVGYLLGVKAELLKQGLESFTGDGRRQFIEVVAGITVIDDSYNASPDSMRAALKVLAGKEGRKVAVLGDMLELGAYEEQGHRDVATVCTELGIDVVLAVGSRSKVLYEALPESCEKYHLGNATEARDLLETLLKPGDCLLLKASNYMNFGMLAKDLKERLV